MSLEDTWIQNVDGTYFRIVYNGKTFAKPDADAVIQYWVVGDYGDLTAVFFSAKETGIYFPDTREELISYTKCPECKVHEFKTNELNIGHKLPAFCEFCGSGWDVTRRDDSSLVFTLNKEMKKRKTLVLNTLHGNVDDKPVYFVVIGHFVVYNNAEIDEEQIKRTDRYHYEDHMCPAVLLNKNHEVQVFHGEDEDPHGLIKHVQTVFMPDFQESLALEADYDTSKNEIELRTLTLNDLKKLFSLCK